MNGTVLHLRLIRHSSVIVGRPLGRVRGPRPPLTLEFALATEFALTTNFFTVWGGEGLGAFRCTYEVD